MHRAGYSIGSVNTNVSRIYAFQTDVKGFLPPHACKVTLSKSELDYSINFAIGMSVLSM